MKRTENCLTDSIAGGAIAVLAVMAACLVAMMLTVFAAIGVVLLLFFWIGTKSPALLAFVVAGVITAAVAWLLRAPVRRAINAALAWMVPRLR